MNNKIISQISKIRENKISPCCISNKDLSQGREVGLSVM